MGTKDKANRAVKHARGKAKEGLGKLIDDPAMETEGRIDQVVADGGDVVDNVAEQVKRSLRADHSPKGAQK